MGPKGPKIFKIEIRPQIYVYILFYGGEFNGDIIFWNFSKFEPYQGTLSLKNFEKAKQIIKFSKLSYTPETMYI